jgi:nitroreductase
MEFFDAVKRRRSVRRFTTEKVPREAIVKGLEAAILAPNSSNTQTWDFYWVNSPEKKSRLVEGCLSQSAARTACDLVVIVADPKKWKRSQGPLIQWVESVKAPQQVKMYYEKLIPLTYRWGFLNTFGFLRWIGFSIAGLFRPVPRGPNSKAETQLVAVKSAALAAENFVLAMAAQGLATCMMEGFDEFRVKRLLGLGFSARVVMVIGIGYEAEKGTWGPQMRLPYSQVVHEV